jgi:hypothetical protein
LVAELSAVLGPGTSNNTTEVLQVNGLDQSLDIATFKLNDDTASQGPTVAIDRNSTTPADGDKLGRLAFFGNSIGPSPRTVYAFIRAEADDVSNGVEVGSLHLGANDAGTTKVFARVKNDALRSVNSKQIISASSLGVGMGNDGLTPDAYMFYVSGGDANFEQDVVVSGDLTVSTNLNVSGNTTVPYMTYLSGPGITLAEGQVAWNDDKKTLDIQTGTDTTLQVGQEQVIRVRNETGTTMPNGCVAYVSGSKGEGAAKLLVASATNTTPEETEWLVGIITEEIANNADGFMTREGLVNGVDTSLYPVGTILYVNGPGLYTSAQPAPPNHAIRLGLVERQSATEGAIFVHPEVGGETTTLHDVANTKPTTTGEVLVWDNGVGYYSPGDHGDLAGLADDDHPQYVLSATNNQLSSDVSNHIASASVHFTEASISHNNIGLTGINTHAQIDTKITQLDNHIASGSVHFTEASIDHGSIAGLSDDDHTQYVLADGTRDITGTQHFDVNIEADGSVSAVGNVSGANIPRQDFIYLHMSSNYTLTGLNGIFEHINNFDTASDCSASETSGTWALATNYVTLPVGKWEVHAGITVQQADAGTATVSGLLYYGGANYVPSMMAADVGANPRFAFLGLHAILDITSQTNLRVRAASDDASNTIIDNVNVTVRRVAN